MRRIIVLLYLSSLAGGSALSGQETSSTGGETSGPEITIHGYLSQAYARSDGHQILGITEDGTADYRTAAVQIRADLNASDAIVIQLSHESLGRSPIQQIREEVELDWVFYSHRFGNSTIKVGRAPIPFGIYNEVRDVSTLLPFYRPPHNFYGEISYSSETLDGVVLSHDFSLGGRWSLETDLHAGGWQLTERDSLGRYTTSGVDNSLGAELWLDTPVSGLRFGAGTMRYDVDRSATGEKRWTAWHVSLAGDFDRFALHGEVKEIDVGSIYDIRTAYLHLGLRVTEKLTVNVQREISGFTRPPDFRWTELDDDRVLGLSYALSPSLLVQAEHHWNEDRGIWLEDLTDLAGATAETRYWIINLSTSF